MKWGSKNSTRASPGGEAGPSPYYTQGFGYGCSPKTFLPPSNEFPAVPYAPQDFHCERALNSWTDPLDLNAGWLTGLTDLNTERDSVRERIADYLTYLVSVGFSGFRPRLRWLLAPHSSACGGCWHPSRYARRRPRSVCAASQPQLNGARTQLGRGRVGAPAVP